MRDLKRDLRRAGFDWRPGKGSHTFWFHPLLPDVWTLSGKDGDDAQGYHERKVRELVEKAYKAQENPQ